MNLSKFLFFPTRDRLFQWCLSILILTIAPASHAIREASISSYISAPHGGTSAIMRGGAFAFAGGVMPRGDASFMLEDGRILDPGSVSIVANSSSGRTAIQWDGKQYEVMIDRDLTCPLARLVKNDRLIAFTIPIVANDHTFLLKQGLIVAGGGYAARELVDHADLLSEIDVESSTDDIHEPKIKKFILDSMNQMVKQSAHLLSSVDALGRVGEGTYVNADFNVTYHAYLVTKGNRRFVDFAGLPLRYSWQLSSDRKTPVFYKVKTFTFPRASDQKQLRAISFFHNAALFRRLKLQNAGAFDRYVEAVCSAK